MAALTRSTFYDVLAADVSLADWSIYAEPPSVIQGLSIVVAPRDPYQSYSTYGELETHLSVSILVPRTHGPAMDLIDTALAALRTIYTGIRGCEIGSTAVGLIDRISGVEYIAAMTDVNLS